MSFAELLYSIISFTLFKISYYSFFIFISIIYFFIMNKNCDFFLKTVLIGNTGVGKTSLMNRIIDNTFEENYIATVAVDFKTRIYEIEGRKIKLDIWDTAG